MKRIIICILFFVAVTQILRVQNKYDIKVEEALNNSEWFELRDAYAESRDSLSPMLKAFTESMLAYNFNRNEAACRAIERLIDEYQAEIGAGNVMSMMYFKANVLKRMGLYHEAAAQLNSVCETFKPYVDSTALAAYDEFKKQYEILAEYNNVNEVTISENEGVASFRLDSIGRADKRSVTIMIPAKVNGIAQDVVFDTGAGVNVVSVSTAKRLGLDVYDIGTQMTGFGTQQGGFAIAKEFVMGNITVKNVPFYVMDISSGVDSIDAHMKHLQMIVGVELIAAVKELHLDFSRSAVVVPKETTVLSQNELPNMCYGTGGLFCVEAAIDGNQRFIHLDTGATWGQLTNRYYALHSDSIASNCVSGTARMAGAGGIPTIPVSTDSNSSADLGYGNLGMNYMLQFRKVIYNTDKMFVKLVR